MATDFSMLKNKEEMQDFLHNLGIEYRYSCYENKNPEGCELLAEFVELIEQNIPKSSRLYKFTCDTYGLGRSCHNYGNASFFGRGIKKNYMDALNYYSKACLHGHAVSCFNAGQLYFNEHKEVRELIPRNLDTAFTLFEKGCSFNNADSCSYATFLSYSGFLNTRPPDHTKSIQFAERGCKLNDINCCNYLIKAYKDGLGCEKNEDKSKEAADKLADILDQMKIKNPRSR